MELGQECMDLCFDGHSVLITGQAGTGKTTLLKKIVSAIKCNKTKKVQIYLCAATGISTLQFSSRAQTLHSWAGIKDGIDGIHLSNWLYCLKRRTTTVLPKIA